MTDGPFGPKKASLAIGLHYGNKYRVSHLRKRAILIVQMMKWLKRLFNATKIHLGSIHRPIRRTKRTLSVLAVSVFKITTSNMTKGLWNIFVIRIWNLFAVDWNEWKSISKLLDELVSTRVSMTNLFTTAYLNYITLHIFRHVSTTQTYYFRLFKPVSL